MPRGIVGSERGGVLTNQLKDNPYSRRAARRGREGEPEPAEPVPAGVRRRLADRRPRQARLSERRDRHHDVERRVRALPQAHEPARIPVRARSASSQVQGEVMRELERRFPPEFRNRIDEVVLFAPLTQGRGAGDRAAATSSRSRATLQARGQDAERRAEALEQLVERGLQPGVRRAVPEARRSTSTIKLPISEQLEGRPRVPRAPRRRRGRGRRRRSAARRRAPRAPRVRHVAGRSGLEVG